MTDDQRWDTVTPRYMPDFTSLVSPHGVSFSNSFVSNPLCCPSRVTTLTGKYSYATGIYGNRGTWGGYGASLRYGAMDDTIATDLQSDGYATALVGKYLNGYNPRTDYTYVPPGWDRWFNVRGGSYYNYYAAVDGVSSMYFGDRPNDYSTRVLQDQSLSFIKDATASSSPFFLYFAPTAPHAPAIADPRDTGRFDGDVSSYVEPPSVPEADLADKPGYIRDNTWSTSLQAHHDAFHAKQLAAIYGVDRAIGAIWRALPDNTVVLFMSDNGFEWGEHDWFGKMVPYNESLRVPMIIASKGVDLSTVGPVGGISDRLALNVDIRSTLESFVGDLTRQPQTDGEPWTTAPARQEFPIMHWNDNNKVPVYCGVRSRGWMYVRYADGFEEAYDEQADPFELDNVFVTDPTDPHLPLLRAAAAGYCTRRDGRIYPDGWPF
ncbi:MAG: sulfatase [Actinomycetota bacterium]|nr:sulfatase [Actinomycetota bacterium]